MLSPCHTAAILTPENSEQVHQTTVSFPLVFTHTKKKPNKPKSKQTNKQTNKDPTTPEVIYSILVLCVLIGPIASELILDTRKAKEQQQTIVLYA
jgi:hypothetical protein